MQIQDIFNTLIQVIRTANDLAVLPRMRNKPKMLLEFILRELLSTELTYVGSGSFSLVVQHHSYPDRVFKVSTRSTDGYRKYAEFCKQSTSPHVPTIYSTYEFEGFMCYEIQKYEPISNFLVSSFAPTVYVSPHVEEAVKVLKHNVCSSKHRELFVVANMIRSLYASSYEVDLHDDNIMLSPDGVVVIVDPLSCPVEND